MNLDCFQITTLGIVETTKMLGSAWLCSATHSNELSLVVLISLLLNSCLHNVFHGALIIEKMLCD